MTTFAVQYLGSRPEEASPQTVRRRLHEACQRLPISMVLLDWDLPAVIEDAVAEETARQGAKLYRWQTWLTGDPHTDLPHEWLTVGHEGNTISGYTNDPDFTFICPNRSAVEDFLAERLEAIAALGLFQGIFLDRIRFPSPASNPASQLGCFCRHCARLAADAGLDLEAVHRYIASLLADADGARRLVRGLLRGDDNPTYLDDFLDFRQKSITRIVHAAKKLTDSLNLSVGLDCFSPALTRMVGQNLSELSQHCDWIKLMIYPRVYGPAGIPFELSGLIEWLLEHGSNESEALDCIRQASGLPIPATNAELQGGGLGPETMATEIQRGRRATHLNLSDQTARTPLLAGIALVEVKGIHESTPKQICADLEASRAAEGLVLSWDLWQIPLEYLDTIRTIWEKP